MVDFLEVFLRGVVCAAYVYRCICYTVERESVAHKSNGSSVEYDIVVALAQVGYEFVEFYAI